MLQLILGPMYSGKTTELFRVVERYNISKKKCTIIKYAEDTRYGHNAYTHNLQEMPAISTLNLMSVDISNYDVIGIDEGQFFPDIFEFILKNQNKIIIIAGLDGDFRREPFLNLLKLIPYANKVKKLNAICMKCFNKASYTKRISEEMEIKVIGGKDKYLAVCANCF